MSTREPTHDLSSTVGPRAGNVGIRFHNLECIDHLELMLVSLFTSDVVYSVLYMISFPNSHIPALVVPADLGYKPPVPVVPAQSGTSPTYVILHLVFVAFSPPQSLAFCPPPILPRLPTPPQDFARYSVHTVDVSRCPYRVSSALYRPQCNRGSRHPSQ